MSQENMKILGICLFLFGIICMVAGIGMIIWQGKKRGDKYKQGGIVEPPKPKTYTIITDVVFVNNKTDKEYKYISVNDFGLKVQEFRDGSWVVRQYLSFRKSDSDEGVLENMAHLDDFSVVSIGRKSVTHTPSE